MWVILLFVFPVILGYGLLISYSLPIGLIALVSIVCLVAVLCRPFLAVLAFIFTWSFGDLLNLPVTPEGIKISILILIASFLIWIAKALLFKDRDLFITPLTKPVHILVLTFLIICVVSIMNSRNLKLSLLEIQEFLYCVIIYFFLVFNVRKMQQLKKTVFAFVAGGFVVSLFGIAEGAGWDVYSHLKYHSLFGSSLPSAILISPPKRINGLIGDADFHGIYMGVVFLFALYLFLTRGSKVLRLFCSAVMLLSVINIVGAASRGAALGFLFSLLIFWIFIELRFKWLISVLMLGGILLLGSLMVTLLPDLDIERFYRPTGKAKSTLVLRKNNVMIGLAMSLDHPILGNGPDGFVANYHRFASRIDPSSQKRTIKPLNVYIQVLVEYGIVGITIFLSILGLAVRSLFLLVKGSTGNDRYLPAALLAGVCGYSVFMAFTGSVVNQCYWTLVALSPVMGSVTQSEVSNDTGSTAHQRRVVGLPTSRLPQGES